jgi:hypothetical protein
MTYLYIQVYKNEHFTEMIGESTRMTCSTVNMSYDLRGDILLPRKTDWIFNNSEIGPQDPIGCSKKRILAE